MKVVHIESGLGNQMLSYAEFLVIKKLNPNDKCFIETIIYEIPDCNDVICQWNGYELERVFGIKEKNIKSIFTVEQWDKIINDVKNSNFWADGWRYAPAIIDAFSKQGILLENCIGSDAKYIRPKQTIKSRILGSRLIYFIKRKLRPLYKKRYIEKFNFTDKIFIKSDKNIFAGQSLGLKNRGVDLDFIKDEILNVFKFPELKDEKNIEIAELITSCNSVAIHARRGDMLQSNGYCYKFGYFKRATKFIKKKIKNPVFFFFCDTGSIEWCKENEKIFGLNFKKDTVYFVDWNVGQNSYIDMQLMGYCKHNIITNSSFGWWGCFFNQNPDKITISPNLWMNTTNTF